MIAAAYTGPTPRLGARLIRPLPVEKGDALRHGER
jgi:hypothetical protein